MLTRNPPEGRFLIFGQSRSGSTLLRGFLNAHPKVDCRNELLTSWVPWPETYCEAHSRLSRAPVYGCKVFVHHLIDDQGVEDIRGFLAGVQRRGFQLVYLRRENLIRHALSNFLRKRTGVTHAQESLPDLEAFKLDIARFVRHLHVRDRFWNVADEAISDLEHHALSYERDLVDPDGHQHTANEVFRFLGLEPVSVQARLRRINDRRLTELIQNYEELERALAGGPFERWLSA